MLRADGNNIAFDTFYPSHIIAAPAADATATTAATSPKIRGVSTTPIRKKIFAYVGGACALKPHAAIKGARSRQ
ncbi:MAG: hypothetical protein O3B16_06285 [Chloroflexi bacterium]|nr:hypothetical protein [Chloroflexota bacterium]